LKIEVACKTEFRPTANTNAEHLGARISTSVAFDPKATRTDRAAAGRRASSISDRSPPSPLRAFIDFIKVRSPNGDVGRLRSPPLCHQRRAERLK
jgi:hypothetical protein